MSDFFRPVIVSQRLDSPVVAAFQNVLIRAQQILPWLPNLTGESASMFYGNPAKYPALNIQPEGLTQDQQKQWKLIWDAMQPISSKVLRGEIQGAAIDGEKLARDAAFWDRVHRVTTAVATVGGSEITPLVEEKWLELRAKMKEWRMTRQWALDIAASPQCPQDKATEVRRRVADLDSTLAGKLASVIAQAPGMNDALRQDGLNGIAALAAVANIKTAVLLAAIAAVVGIIVYCISSVKTIINDLGLQAIGEAVKSGQKFLGPWLGVAIFAGIGFIVYRKMTQPKTVLRLSR